MDGVAVYGCLERFIVRAAACSGGGLSFVGVSFFVMVEVNLIVDCSGNCRTELFI